MSFQGAALRRGNQRVIAISTTPTASAYTQITGAATQPIFFYGLSSTNLTFGSVLAYFYAASAYPNPTAAASAAAVTFAWQFRNAAHVNVGSAITAFRATVGANGVNQAAVFSHADFYPHWPLTYFLTIPATATELGVTVNTVVLGAPTIDCNVEYGIDFTNTGTTGDIGMAGMNNQGTNSPNTF